MKLNTRNRRYAAVGALLVALGLGFTLGEKAGAADVTNHRPSPASLARLTQAQAEVAHLGLSCWLEFKAQGDDEVVCQSAADHAVQLANSAK